MLNFVYTLLKNRWVIARYTLIVAIMSSIYVLVIPKTFTSSSTIMMGGGGNNILSGALSDLSQLGITSGMMGGQTDQMRIFTLCESRTLKEKMVRKHDLMQYFDEPIFDKALLRFTNALGIELSQKGTIDISVSLSTGWISDGKEDQAVKVFAADLANSFVKELDSLNVRLNTTEASARELFLENRLKLVSGDLATTEENLKNFEQKFGIISLPDQLTGSVDMSVELARQLIQSEMELDLAKISLEKDNPVIQTASDKISIIKQKLKELNLGHNTLTQSIGIPGQAESPDIVLNYYRLKRDIEIQGAIFKYLTQEYESAKLDAAKTIPTIQVLDYAVPPYKKSHPKRMIIVFLLTVLTIFFSVLYLMLLEGIAVDKLEKLDANQQLRYLLNVIHPKRFFSRL